MTSTCLSTTWPDNSFAWGRQSRKMENGRGKGGRIKGRGGDSHREVGRKRETKVRRQVQRTFLSHTYKLRARLCRVRFGLSTKDLGERTQDKAVRFLLVVKARTENQQKATPPGDDSVTHDRLCVLKYYSSNTFYLLLPNDKA